MKKPNRKEIIAAVKADRATGMKYTAIAKKYGIHTSSAELYGKRPDDMPLTERGEMARKKQIQLCREKYISLLPAWHENKSGITTFCRKNKISSPSFAAFLDSQGIDYQKNPSKAWTNDQVVQIISDRQSGSSYLEIAKKAGRSANAIRKVCAKHLDVIQSIGDLTKKRIRPPRLPKPLSTDCQGLEPREWRFNNIERGYLMQKSKYDLRQYQSVTPTMWQREQVQVVANVLAWSHDEARAAIKHTRSAVGYGIKA